MNRRRFVTGMAATMAAMGMRHTGAQTATCQTSGVGDCTATMLRSFKGKFSAVYIESFPLDSVGGREAFLTTYVDDWAERNANLVWDLGWSEFTDIFEPRIVDGVGGWFNDGEYRVLDGMSSQPIVTEQHDGEKNLYVFFIHDGETAYTVTICFMNDDNELLLLLLGSGVADIYETLPYMEGYKIVDRDEIPQLWKAA